MATATAQGKKYEKSEAVLATEITPSQLAATLKTLLTIPSPDTIFVWGPPGIGKTEIIHQVCDALGFTMIGFRAAYRDATDIKGFPQIETVRVLDNGGDPIPVLAKDGTAILDTNGQPIYVTEKLTGYARPKWLPVRPEDKCCIFADEVNRATTLTMNALMELFQERRIEEFVLSPQTALIAACNREQDGGGVQRMPQALCNRGFHFQLRVSADDWYDWAAMNKIHPMVLASIRSLPELLYKFSSTEKTFPTPRMWTKISRIMHTNPPKEVFRNAVIAAVGYEPAIEFLQRVELAGMLPTIDHIILNPKSAVVPTEASAQYAISRCLSTYATKGNLENIFEYMYRMPPEFRTLAVQDMVKRDQALSFTPEFSEWVVKDKGFLP